MERLIIIGSLMEVLEKRMPFPMINLIILRHPLFNNYFNYFSGNTFINTFITINISIKTAKIPPIPENSTCTA